MRWGWVECAGLGRVGVGWDRVGWSGTGRGGIRWVAMGWEGYDWMLNSCACQRPALARDTPRQPLHLWVRDGNGLMDAGELADYLAPRQAQLRTGYVEEVELFAVRSGEQRRAV